MATVSGYLGFTRSFIHVPMPLVVAEYSVTRFPAAYGLSMVVGGVIGLSAGCLVGKRTHSMHSVLSRSFLSLIKIIT
jgi:hypothetical protein